MLSNHQLSNDCSNYTGEIEISCFMPSMRFQWTVLFNNLIHRFCLLLIEGSGHGLTTFGHLTLGYIACTFMMLC